MSKKQTYILAAGLMVIVGVWAVGKWLHGLPKPVNPAFTQNGAPATISDKDKVLEKGSRGLEVGLLQHKMGGLVIDGIFGEKTEARLRQLRGVSKISLNGFDNKA